MSERDSNEYAFSPSRWSIVASNLDRCRRLAEHLLIPTPENVEKARATRSTMARRSRGEVDDAFLALVVANGGHAGTDAERFGIWPTLARSRAQRSIDGFGQPKNGDSCPSPCRVASGPRTS